jgi:hypothetical protein
MKASTFSETSVNYQTTWRKIPEDSHLHSQRREDLKSHCGSLARRMLAPRNASMPLSSSHVYNGFTFSAETKSRVVNRET